MTEQDSTNTTDESNSPAEEANTESKTSKGTGTPPGVGIVAQYIKDLSFEHPKAPASLLSLKESPQIDLHIDLRAQKVELGENAGPFFEVALQITAKALPKEGEDPLFLVDLTYAGLFTLERIAEEQREPTLLIYCPNMLFPFARRIIADTSRDGGMPPLMLDPIDFARLYMQRQQEQKAS